MTLFCIASFGLWRFLDEISRKQRATSLIECALPSSSHPSGDVNHRIRSTYNSNAVWDQGWKVPRKIHHHLFRMMCCKQQAWAMRCKSSFGYCGAVGNTRRRNTVVAKLCERQFDLLELLVVISFLKKQAITLAGVANRAAAGTI